jgi:hypothetical protein
MAAASRKTAQRAVLGAMAAMLVGGTAVAAAPSSPGSSTQLRHVRNESYEQGMHGEWAKSMTRVVQSATEWDALQQEMARDGGLVWTGRRASDLNVNWSRNALVVVSLGEMPAPTCKVSVVDVWRVGDQLLVQTQVEPTYGAYDPVSPYAMVLVERGRWVSASTDMAQGPAGAAPGRGLWGGSGPAPTAPSVAASWGGVKGLYR